MTEWTEGFLWGFACAWAGTIFNSWVAGRRFRRELEKAKAGFERRRKELDGK